MFWRNRVAPLIQKLKSADAAERKAAAEALDKLKRLSVDECRTALEAACEAFPSFEEEFFGSGRFALYSSAETMLLSLARERVHQSFVQIIQRDFARYSPEGRAYACLILKEIDTDESWAALRELILQHGALGIADSPSLRVDNEAQARRLFPQALALLGQSSVGAFRYELAKLCLEGFDKGWFHSGEFDAYAPQIVSAYQDAAQWLAVRQSPEALQALWDDEEHLRWRWAGGVLLDLMGYFSREVVVPALREAIQVFRDPYLLVYAVRSLVKHGEPVEAELLTYIAASDETRSTLFRKLRELGRLDLFPRAYAEQPLIAQSDMVDWLIFPTELGRPPGEIQWMGVREVLTDEGEAEVYLFRFRETPDEPWQAGLAGPYLKEEIPTCNALGGTFSRFEKWDECSPEEHVKRILQTVGAIERVETPDGEKLFWSSMFGE